MVEDRNPLVVQDSTSSTTLDVSEVATTLPVRSLVLLNNTVLVTSLCRKTRPTDGDYTSCAQGIEASLLDRKKPGHMGIQHATRNTSQQKG